MHPLQQKLLKLSSDRDIGGLSYRQIGELVNVEAAQTIKYHLGQLSKRGLIQWDPASKLIKRIVAGQVGNSPLVAVPILGSANCGPANEIAQESAVGYLQVSRSYLLGEYSKFFALRTVGDSMNQADVGGQAIEDGDYVIIDGSDRQPPSQSYVLSIIGGCANIKKYIKDEQHEQVVLISESSSDYPPICIHQNDIDNYLINGRVIRVIKNPKSVIGS